MKRFAYKSIAQAKRAKIKGHSYEGIRRGYCDMWARIRLLLVKGFVWRMGGDDELQFP